MGQNACPVGVWPYSYLPLGVGLILARPAQHLTPFAIPIARSSVGGKAGSRTVSSRWEGNGLPVT